MNAKDALIIALTVENQNLRSERDALRSWLSARLPRITIKDNVFIFDDGENFGFRLDKMGHTISVAAVAQGVPFLALDVVIPPSLDVIPPCCSHVLFNKDCVVFFTLDQDGSFKRIFKIEMTNDSYSASRDAAQYGVAAREELACNENPLFHTLEFERKLREFCARHHLLKEAP